MTDTSAHMKACADYQTAVPACATPSTHAAPTHLSVSYFVRIIQKHD